jgi:hypothetical protein
MTIIDHTFLDVADICSPTMLRTTKKINMSETPTSTDRAMGDKEAMRCAPILYSPVAAVYWRRPTTHGRIAGAYCETTVGLNAIEVTASE